MQQRQPRLGDILDDYCPRERRLTNHVVVAMIGDAVKQTRCTTCDADHEYKHAAIPRQRKKAEESTLYSQVLAGVAPKKVVPSQPTDDAQAEPEPQVSVPVPESRPHAAAGVADFDALFQASEAAPPGDDDEPVEEGPLHRRLIRAQLPRHEGQVSTTRQAPDFTIRQPTNARAKRFSGVRPHRGGAAPLQSSNRQGGNGNGNSNGSGNGNARGSQRHGGRPGGSRPANNRPGGGHNRTK
jgi:hypothetical protein